MSCSGKNSVHALKNYLPWSDSGVSLTAGYQGPERCTDRSAQCGGSGNPNMKGSVCKKSCGGPYGGCAQVATGPGYSSKRCQGYATETPVFGPPAIASSQAVGYSCGSCGGNRYGSSVRAALTSDDGYRAITAGLGGQYPTGSSNLEGFGGIEGFTGKYFNSPGSPGKGCQIAQGSRADQDYGTYTSGRSGAPACGPNATGMSCLKDPAIPAGSYCSGFNACRTGMTSRWYRSGAAPYVRCSSSGCSPGSSMPSAGPYYSSYSPLSGGTSYTISPCSLYSGRSECKGCSSKQSTYHAA